MVENAVTRLATIGPIWRASNGQGWRIAVVVAVGLVVLVGLTGSLFNGGRSELDLIPVGLSFYLVGAYVVIRVPGNRVTWLLLAVALGFGLTSLAWLPDEIGTVSNFIGIFAIILPGLAVFLPLWFPTGVPPTSRWRWAEAGGWLAIGALLFSIVFGLATGEFTDDVEGCLSLTTCVELSSVVAVLLLMPVAVAALVVRWVRSRGIERQQLKVTVPAFCVFLVGTAVQFGGGQGLRIADWLFLIGVLVIPISIGVSVARYRLYDIDRIVSRTVTYTVVVALLAVLVAGVATAVGAQFQRPSVVAATTLAVVALFNPVRRRVQVWVDRRFNRSRYVTEQVIEEFTAGLRDGVDGDSLVEGWIRVVSDTMQPSTVGVWVKG